MKYVICAGYVWSTYDNGSGYYELDEQVREASEADLLTYPEYTSGVQNF